jgi:hypothetical protein
MSAQLDSLLDPQRRRDVALWDALTTITTGCSALERQAVAQPLVIEPAAYSDWAAEDATMQALGNAEAVTDWLAAECMGRTSATAGADRLMRAPGRYAAADAAEVLAAALISAQRGDAEECLVAVTQLVRRYTTEHKSTIDAAAAATRHETAGDLL